MTCGDTTGRKIAELILLRLYRLGCVGTYGDSLGHSAVQVAPPSCVTAMAAKFSTGRSRCLRHPGRCPPPYMWSWMDMQRR